MYVNQQVIFHYPRFDKNIPGKVNDQLKVVDEHTVACFVGINNTAVAVDGFPSTVNGIHVFVTKTVRGDDSYIPFYGFTSDGTYNTAASSVYPGRNGICGVCLDQSRFDLQKKPQEVVSILKISGSGNKIEVQWIIDGETRDFVDVTNDFIKGNDIFPALTLCEGQKLQVIPFDKVNFRATAAVDQLFKIYEAQKSGAAASSINNNQSVIITQLQQELKKEKEEHEKTKKDRDAQLQEKDQIIQQKDTQLQQQGELLQQNQTTVTSLQQQISTLQQQLSVAASSNSNSSPPSPFIKDKPYQIDFVANNLTPPSDPHAFGGLINNLSQSSPLFQHVKNDLWRKLGTCLPSPRLVSGFTLESVEVIHSDPSGLEVRMRRLQQLRAQNGNFFNPPSGSFSAEQLQLLIALRDQFLARPSNAHEKAPNLINVFHGTRVDRLQSVVNGLVAVRSTDAGFFGSGVYTTPSIEYAAKYAQGDFDFKDGPYQPRQSDGCYPVVWCVAAVGVCYPLTREADYSKNRVHDGMGVSDYFASPLNPGYDCHCVAVNETANFQAVPRKEMQYMEIVFDQEVQVLPIAVLWVKPM